MSMTSIRLTINQKVCLSNSLNEISVLLKTNISQRDKNFMIYQTKEGFQTLIFLKSSFKMPKIKLFQAIY